MVVAILAIAAAPIVIATFVLRSAYRPVALEEPTMRTGGAGTRPDETGPTRAEPEATWPGQGPVLGVAINAHHISRLDLYLAGVDRIAGMGANALIVMTPMFQDRVNSSEVRFLPERCPTDEQLIAILERASSCGLRTALLPIVLIENPQDKEWRGVIQPESWNDWWDSYDELIDRFVGIANAASVDMLGIGSELNSTEPQVARWERIASRVREQYPGRLMYSANWDRYDKVQTWSLVDVMCVSSYFEIGRDDPEASAEELAANWAREREALMQFAARQGRPLILSEVGYPSLPSAAKHPWNYVAEAGTRADHEAQNRCFEAFFLAWIDTFADRSNNAIGFFCYRWDPYHHGDDRDTGYGLSGKPSFETVKRGFAAIKAGH
jgi:hypothetical protein